MDAVWYGVARVLAGWSACLRLTLRELLAAASRFVEENCTSRHSAGSGPDLRSFQLILCHIGEEYLFTLLNALKAQWSIYVPPF